MIDYMKEVKELDEQRWQEREYDAAFRKRATPYIEAGKDFFAFAHDWAVKEDDQERYEKLAEEMKTEKQLGETFMQAFSADPYFGN